MVCYLHAKRDSPIAISFDLLESKDNGQSNYIYPHFAKNIQLIIVLPQLRQILDSNNEASILGALGSFDKICEDGAINLEQKDREFFSSLISWCISNMSHNNPKIR